MASDYKTQRKTELLDFLRTHKNEAFTVEEICQSLYGSTSCLSTVYRLLGKMRDKGILRKYTSHSNHALYQYVGESSQCLNHLHMKCLKCGKIWHMECAFNREFQDHILSDHAFHLDCSQSILYGLCETCYSGPSSVQEIIINA